MTNDAAMFLRDARQEARLINKCDQWNIETIAHTHEARHLISGVNIDHARHDGRFLTDNANAVSANTGETDNGIARPIWLNFKEGIFVYDFFNHLMHYVRFARVKRDHTVERFIHASEIICGLYVRRVLDIVGWQV